MLLIPDIRELGRTKQHLYGDKPGNQNSTFTGQKRELQQSFLDFIDFGEKLKQWQGFTEVAREEADYFSCASKHAQKRWGRWHNQLQIWSRIWQQMRILLPHVI